MWNYEDLQRKNEQDFSPKAAAAGCVKREQRSERGSHVGAETSQLRERNAAEKNESRSFSFGGHVVLLVSRVSERQTRSNFL